MRGSFEAHEQGLIITTSDGSSGAVEEAVQTETPIALMNGELNGDEMTAQNVCRIKREKTMANADQVGIAV